MSQLQCAYHPESTAVDRCHSCLRYICLRDKQVLVTSQGSTIYCPPCYATAIEQNSRHPFSLKLAIIIAVIILIFFSGFALLMAMLVSEITFLTYFFVGFAILAALIVLGVQQLVSRVMRNPEGLEEAHHIRQEWEASLQKGSQQFCMQCGAPISSTDTFCQGCGEQLKPAK